MENEEKPGIQSIELHNGSEWVPLEIDTTETAIVDRNIDPRELRIGNCVLGGASGQMFRLTFDMLWYIAKGHATVVPIPLTPELLKKCGFVREKSIKKDWEGYDIIAYNTKPLTIPLAFGPDAAYLYEVDCSGADKQYDSPIHFLHQLQNLYFSLTGEELKVIL